MSTTTLSNLINPQVMADMLPGKINNAIVVTPFAKIDTTLVGSAGSTITVPQYGYIGDAADVAEGGDVGDVQLTATAKTYTVKKAGIGVTLTDEALLSAFGNPVGETTNQLAKAIASKLDNDAIVALMGATQGKASASAISYNGIVEAIDVLREELNTAKVMFVAPEQLTVLRKDSNFISADKYNHDVIFTGEVGQIANTRIVPSRKIVKYNKVYLPCTSTTADALKVVASSPSTGEVAIATVKNAGYFPADVAVNDYVVLACNSNAYVNPIVKIETDERTEDEVPAITIYTKRDTSVETERDTHHKTTYISADKHYCVALTNAAKVVLATFTA